MLYDIGFRNILIPFSSPERGIFILGPVYTLLPEGVGDVVLWTGFGDLEDCDVYRGDLLAEAAIGVFDADRI